MQASAPCSRQVSACCHSLSSSFQKTWHEQTSQIGLLACPSRKSRASAPCLRYALLIQRGYMICHLYGKGTAKVGAVSMSQREIACLCTMFLGTFCVILHAQTLITQQSMTVTHIDTGLQHQLKTFLFSQKCNASAYINWSLNKLSIPALCCPFAAGADCFLYYILHRMQQNGPCHTNAEVSVCVIVTVALSQCRDYYHNLSIAQNFCCAQHPSLHNMHI